MRKVKVFLSIFLSVSFLIFSQPVYAATQIKQNNGLRSSDTKANFEVLSVESRPLTINEIVNRKATLSSLEEGASDGSIIKRVELKENSSVNVDSISPSASGSDLAIGNLTTNPSTQPFSYTDDTDFKMLVANLGSASISNVRVAVLIDGSESWMDNLGTFSSGYGATYIVSVKGLCGIHRIEFTVEGDATETNTGNNKCGGNYTWKSVIDLAALAPEQVDGTLVCTEPFEVKAPVVNYGDISATDVQVNFVLAGWDAGSINLDLPARTGKIITLELTFNACGGGQFDVEVDKDKRINDADRSNNFTTRQFYITPEEDRTIGRYQGTISIKMAIAPSAHDLLDGSGKHISYSDANNAMTEWNGIVNDARVAVVENVQDESPDGYHVVLSAYPGNSQDFIAETKSTVINGQWIDTDLRRMTLNTYYFDGNDATIGKKELVRTLTHETGHVFGLDHPQCRSKAIMQQSVYLESGLASYAIELHDSANLKYLYS